MDTCVEVHDGLPGASQGYALRAITVSSGRASSEGARGTLLSSGTEEQCNVHKDRQESACIGATSIGAIHGGQTWPNSRLNATRCGEAWWLPPPTAPLSHSPSCFLFCFRSSVAWISSSRRRNAWQAGRAEEARNGASRIVYYPFSIH